MLNRREVRFERRSILAASQLRTIEKFPREFLRLYFADFGDGILSGLHFEKRGKEVYLTEGLVKFDGEIYFSEEVNLSTLANYTLDGIDYVFTLGAPSRTVNENVITENILIEFKKIEEYNGTFELGRFKAGNGINLPDINAENLAEEFTQNDKIILLDIPYSVQNGTTFHPYIFQAFLAALKLKSNPTPGDTAFMFQIANFFVATIPALRIYVESNGIEWHGNSRENIFNSVLRAIQAEYKINLPEKIITPKEKVKSQNVNTGFFLN